MVSLPICNITLKASKPLRIGYIEHPTTIGEHIRKKRMEKGLSQPQVAKIIGTTTETITSWELGRTEVQSNSFIPKIINFLGYSPIETTGNTLGERIASYRKIHGLTAEEFSKLANVDPTTVYFIESRGRKPIKRTLDRILSLIEPKKV